MTLSVVLKTVVATMLIASGLVLLYWAYGNAAGWYENTYGLYDPSAAELYAVTFWFQAPPGLILFLAGALVARSAIKESRKAANSKR